MAKVYKVTMRTYGDQEDEYFASDIEYTAVELDKAIKEALIQTKTVIGFLDYYTFYQILEKSYELKQIDLTSISVWVL